MKTKFYYLFLCLALTLGTTCLVSCGDDEDEVKPSQTEGNGDENGGNGNGGNGNGGYSAGVAVDLGLSVKWASCNLGASKPEEYGDYYGWGCTEPYAEGEVVDWKLYFKKLGGTGTSYSDCGTSNDPLCDYVYPNDKSIAGTEYDAAHVKLGGKWRMPLITEVQELISNTTRVWTLRDGVYGYKVTSNKNGASIFLPAAGYRNTGDALDGEGSYGFFWSATPPGSGMNDHEYAYGVNFGSSGFGWYRYFRDNGQSIRPVSE